MGGGSLSDQQLKEFDEYLSNSGVSQPAADDAGVAPVRPDPPAPAPSSPRPAPPIQRPIPSPTPPPVPAPAPDPDPDPEDESEEQSPPPAPAPVSAPEPEVESEPEVDYAPEPTASSDGYESYLDDIITLHEQKADDILDLLDKIDAKSHKDIVADLVDEMQYQKGVIRREQEQADNLKQLLKLAADATK
jgi:outer membrane biosynthesis protein TonB